MHVRVQMMLGHRFLLLETTRLPRADFREWARGAGGEGGGEGWRQTAWSLKPRETGPPPSRCPMHAVHACGKGGGRRTAGRAVADGGNCTPPHPFLSPA